MDATETPAPVEDTRTKLDLVFLGADGFPIDGLKGRVIVNGEESSFETDSQGNIDTVYAVPDASVQVHVMRMDGSYKELKSCEVGHADSCWSFISPAVVLELTTDLHQGLPGTVAQEIPNWEFGDSGERDKGREAVDGAAPFEDGFEPTQVVIRDIPIAAMSSALSKSNKGDRAQLKQVGLPDPGKAKATETAKAPVSIGRDANGNPMAVLTQKVKDWWGAWHFPTWNLSWGAHDAAVAPVQGAPAAGTAFTNEQLTNSQEQIKQLIEFAKKQTAYDYPDTSTSATIIASLKNNTFKEPPSKPQQVGFGHCYKHVKVALAYVGIVEGVVADGAPLMNQKAASMAGPSLIAKGFSDVTGEVPDARWAAAGDIITYEWSTKTWADRRKKYGENCLNYGHIDIRDYETYISDFMPDARHPTWVKNLHTSSAYLEYVNIKIYRKVFDPMPTLHIKAFLRCLQYCETFGADPFKLYSLNRGGPPYTYFDGFKVHPAHGMEVGPARDYMAAGAYQIQYRTWRDVVDSGILQLSKEADAFSPLVQDRIAVVLIEENNALHLVRTAQLEAAIQRLQRTWRSLPGASQNAAERTMEKFRRNFNQYLMEEKKKVGLS